MSTIIIVQPCNCSSGFNNSSFGVTGFRLSDSFAPIFIVNIFSSFVPDGCVIEKDTDFCSDGAVSTFKSRT